MHYINFNGRIVPETDPMVSVENRAFRYGDGLFETMLWQDGDIRFLSFHVERLQKSMAALLLDEVGKFDAFFLRSRTEELVRISEVFQDVYLFDDTIYNNIKI